MLHNAAARAMRHIYAGDSDTEKQKHVFYFYSIHIVTEEIWAPSDFVFWKKLHNRNPKQVASLSNVENLRLLLKPCPL